MTTTRQLIIYLERNKIHLVGSNVDSIVSWDIPIDQIVDLEVLKPTDFENMVKAHILSQKIIPAQTALILSPDIYFEKDVPIVPPGTNGSTSNPQEFIDNVPFEHLATATFSFEKMTRTIATNQEFLASVQRAFESAGFSFAAIVPSFLLSQFSVDLTTGFDTQKAAIILKNFEALKAYSLFPHQDITPQTQSEHLITKTAKGGGKRTIVLVVIFVFLIGILIFVIIQSGKSPTAGLNSNVFKSTP